MALPPTRMARSSWRHAIRTVLVHVERRPTMTESEVRTQPPGLVAWPKDALRISFGVIWMIDAVLKWLPGFRSDYVARTVRKLKPRLMPPARTHGSVRPAGRVDESVVDGAGDAGVDCQWWAPPPRGQSLPAPESPERFLGVGDARCNGGRSCAGRARGGLRSRPAGGQSIPT